MAVILKSAMAFVVALALAAPFAGADRHHRHRNSKTHQALIAQKEQLLQKNAASDIAAKEGEMTAEAVIAQAEEQQKKESSTPSDSSPVSAINAGAGTQVRGEDDENDSKDGKEDDTEDSEDSEDGDKDDDDDDQDEDSADSDSKEETDDAEEKVVNKKLEIVSPLGKVVAARRELNENVKQQKLHLDAIAWLKNRSGWTQKIEGQVAKVGAETNAIGLARFLGDIRKDLHRFSTPFYIQHLEEQVEKLKKVQPSLQSKLDKATFELNGGQEDIHLHEKLDVKGGAAEKKPRGSGRKSKSGASSSRDSVTLAVSALLLGIFLQH